MTAEETAIILNLSVNAVRIHLRHIRYKLNCQSIGQCLVKAVRYGLL